VVPPEAIKKNLPDMSFDAVDPAASAC